jgi:nucleotide-binding universal stress UspA family protein
MVRSTAPVEAAMPYKTILVHLDVGARTGARLDLACRLASRFDAHLVGVHALTEIRLPGYAAVMTGQSDQLAEFQAHAAAELRERSEALFRKRVEAAGLAKIEYRATRADALAAVPLHARYADLVVAGQSDEKDASGVEPDFVERLLLAAGRPVLVVPYAGNFTDAGKRVLVAWNASREATRALTDSIPLLREAEAVHVVAFDPAAAAHGEVPGADIGLYLARHGIKVTVSQQSAPDVDVGNQLLSRAADLGADLIVMGAWGHSRLQELVLGGVTQAILQSMTVPVLMSH